MLIRLCWAFCLLGATCMAQNANQVAHVRLKAEREAAANAANTTRPPLTGNPNIDYKWDPNLPVELHGYDLSNYPFYNGLPDDLVDGSYNFTCDDRLDGFYASVHHQCQVYHNCLFGHRYDFLCANYTVFDQKNFICHYVSLVDCAGSEKHYDRNEELYVTTSTTTERSRQPEIIYIERPARPRPAPRPRPNARPFFKVRNRAPSRASPRRQPIDADPEQVAEREQLAEPDQPAQRQPARRQPAQRQPSGSRRPSNRRPPPAVYDDYYNYDNYDYYESPAYYDDYYYDYVDEPTSTTTTTTTPPPPRPIRRQRPQRTRLGQGRRPGGNRPRPNFRPTIEQPRETRVQDDARPLEQDINPIDKNSKNNEPEFRKPINRRRPALRTNRPIEKATTPADPFYDYYDYDNAVSEEPSSTTTSTTTAAPVIRARTPTRPRISRPRRPEPTPGVLVTNDQGPEENNLPSNETVERKPINARRPFRPVPEESSRPAPITSESESPVVNARRPFRPVAEEFSPKDEVQVREPLGSGRRTQGPRFPSRRKPTTQTEPEEVIIEEDPPLAPGIALNEEDSPFAEISTPIRSRVRIGSLRRPQRQQPDYEY